MSGGGKKPSPPRRVAWLSPFSQASDVSRFTRCLLPHMQAESDPAWTFALMVNDNGRRFESALPTAGIHSVADTAQMLSLFDFPVYNVGNNSENHGQIVKVLRRVPGTVVLHDMVYQHLMAWECIERAASRQAYARLVAGVHGTEGLDAVIKSGLVASASPPRYSIWDTPLAERFPLAGMIVQLASSVIVHSEYAERSTREVFKGPILRLALPWDQKPSLTDEEIASWAASTRGARRCTFAAFGHIGRTKNLDRLIRAFVIRPDLLQSARLVIAGYPGDRGYVSELEQLVAQHGLGDAVSFEFSISDRRLRQLKLEADAFINIRMPITEGASGSLTEQLNAAKPVIVFARGSYTEIPDDAAVKLDADRGDAGVAEAMAALARDAEARVRIGGAGRNYVRRIGSADYVSQLKAFLLAEEATLRNRQRLVVPVSPALPWSLADITADDRDWFDGLTGARGMWNAIDVDPQCWSPSPYLEWPADRTARYALGAILGLDMSPALEATAAHIVTTRGGWAFYNIVQLLRRRCWLVRQETLPESLAAHDYEFTGDLDYWRIVTHLEPRLIARLLFVSLLGRGWELGEDLAWTDLIESGTDPRAVIAKFLSTREAQEKIPVAEAGKIHAWCVAKEPDYTSRREPTTSLFKWPLATKVRFGGGANTPGILHGSWYDPEPEGRWMRGRFGLLRFLPVHGGDGDLALELAFRVAGSRAVEPRQVTITSSLGYSQTMSVNSDAVTNFLVHLPLNGKKTEPVSLRIDISRSVCLAELKLSPDSRDLGIMLLTGELRRASGMPLNAPLTVVKKGARPLTLVINDDGAEPADARHEVAPIKQAT